MGCDWSKSAASFEDLHDAPYSLLSVSVEEGGRAQHKASKRASKKRDKRKARDAAKGQDDSAPVVPKSSSSISDGDTRGAHMSMTPSLTLPGRPEGANRRGEDLEVAPNKGISVPAIASGGAKPSLGLGLKLDISKAISQGREPTERQLRKEKLDRYENECTKVEDFMYVGGIRVAQNIQLLKAVGITHVINCSAITTENFFPETFSYKSLYMNDSPGEDLACHIYSVVAVIDEVRRRGQKVLVHCTQGVSRSCSFCIAYLMLLEKISYDDGFQRLKARRGICNPNPGFCSQLVLWGRRVLENKACGQLEYPPRIFRVDYYYPANKNAGVAPMLVDRKDGAGGAKPKKPYALQSIASYIIDSPECVFIWVGSAATSAHRSVADFTVRCLQAYEGSPTQAERCEEGKESERMLAMLQQLQCLLPSECSILEGTETEARPQQQLALLADDSAYLAEKAQRRAEDRERQEREEDAKRVEEQVRAVREKEAEEVRRRVAQEREAEKPALATSAHTCDGDSGGGAGAVKPAFPQGGLPEEVQTPRGKRSDAAALAGLGGAGLKLPLASGGSAVSPIQENSSQDRSASGAGGDSPNGDASDKDFKMRLFEVPQDMGEAWDEIENFDSDDLWSTKAFILVERSDDAVPVYVWIGADYEGMSDPEDEEECHNLATKAVRAFAKSEGITVEEVKVVLEGNEPDAFWDMFELG